MITIDAIRLWVSDKYWHLVGVVAFTVWSLTIWDIARDLQ